MHSFFIQGINTFPKLIIPVLQIRFLHFLYKKQFLCLLFFSIISTSVFSQNISIKGYVIDSTTLDSIPFATVYVKGTSFGTGADYDGSFNLSVPSITDSLWISSMGYMTKIIAIPKNKSTVNINVFLSEDYTGDVILIVPKENPAFRILREVVNNKNVNDKRKLDGYEYETYNRTSIFVNNISDELRQKKVMQQVAGVLDSMKNLKDAEGKAMIPVLMSETISDYWLRCLHYQCVRLFQCARHLF